MGYLQEKRREAQTMLNTFNYELSNEIVNKKLEQQKLIAELIENDKYDGVLNIEDFDIMVETSNYDYFTETETITQVPIRKVLSYDGEVYVEDFDENEYFIDDIREAVFTQIYEAVVELTKQ